MSWEHRIAREFKRRDNKNNPVWFVGNVLSPGRMVGENGEVTYVGALIISAFDGAVMLQENQLRTLSGTQQLYAGQRAVLLGDVFAKTPGSQCILVLGALDDAV